MPEGNPEAYGKKPALKIALGVPKGDAPEEDGADPKEARRMAAQDMMAAVKSDDAELFADALDDFLAVGPMED